MQIHGIFLMTRDGGVLRLTAAGCWAHRWLRWRRKDVSWCRAHSDKMNPPFVHKEEKPNNGFCLDAMLGKHFCLIHDGFLSG